MKAFLILTLCLLLRPSASQDGDNLDELLDTIFTRAPETSVNPENKFSELEGNKGDTEKCECVAYYLCNNGTIIEDGTGIIDIRIDDGPCKDYLSLCCNPSDKIEKPTTPVPPVDKPSGCGIRNPDGVGFRIKGDTHNETQFGEFPWMVAVFRQDESEENANNAPEYFCGGSLIHPQVVLTAAHCVNRKEMKYSIRAGEWDTQTENEIIDHQDREVKTIIIHPEYYSGGYFNDIALLILDSPLEIADNVDTVCLPSQGEIIEMTRCFATGWGQDVYGQEGIYQVILKKVDLPIVPRELCQDQLRKTRLARRFNLHPSFICAGGEGKDTCKGDGGSPLVCPIPGHPRKYYQAGIVSWGVGCGKENVPGLYANVAQLRSWVDQQMDAHNIKKSFYNY